MRNPLNLKLKLNMSDLIELLKFEAKEINHLFDKARLEGKGTPQEVSDRREVAITSFLKKFFPFPYRIAKGNIRDSFGQSSASIDCVLLSPSHPFTTSDDLKYSIILADGVDLAIEVKPELNNIIEIERGLSQLKSVKELVRHNSGITPIPGLNDFTDEYASNAKRIPAILFSNKCYANEYNLIETIVSFYENNRIKKNFQFDMIAVNDRFIIVNSRKDSYFNYKHLNDGIYILNFGELTLSAFLLYLNQLPGCEMKMSTPPITHYLNLPQPYISGIEILNERLRNIELDLF